MSVDFNITAFALATVVVLLTPGPTNVLLATAGLVRGTWGALPLVAFELAGYLTGITACGLFLAQAQETYPWTGVLFRVASSAYLATMAIAMWRAARVLPAAERGLVGPRALFLATLLNPKGLVFASAIFPANAFQTLPAYLAAVALFSGLLIPIGILWIKFGASLSGGKLGFLTPSRLKHGAAVAIGAFSVSIAWTVLR